MTDVKTQRVADSRLQMRIIFPKRISLSANEGLSRVKAAPDEVSGRPSRSGIGDRKSLRVRVDQAIAPSTEKHEKPFDELLDKIVISLAATWSIMQARCWERSYLSSFS